MNNETNNENNNYTNQNTFQDNNLNNYNNQNFNNTYNNYTQDNNLNNYNNQDFNNTYNNYTQDNNLNNQNYQNANYQPIDNAYYDSFENNSNKGKKAIIIISIILIIIAIAVLGFFIYKKVIKKPTTEPSITINEVFNTASSTLLQSGKTYYKDETKLPISIGECNKVTLKELQDTNLIENFNNTCNINETYVKACKLQSGDIHYYTNLSCTDKNLQTNYSNWQEAKEIDLKNNLYDINFTYKLKEIKDTPTNTTGEEIEVWKDELTLEDGTYTIVGEQTYYTYRDLMYKWEITKNYYYQKNGYNNLTNKFKVSEYYITSPDNNYKNKDSATTVYKWYRYTKNIYNNGEYYSTCPDINYPVKANLKTETIYTNQSLPETTYTTKTPQTIYNRREISNKLIKTNYICGSTSTVLSDETTIECKDQELDMFKTTYKYVCYYENGLREEQTSSCKNKYTEWQNTYNDTKCSSLETQNSTCKSVSGYKYVTEKYQWYTNTKKSYYPSGSESSSGEKIYYATAPVNEATKDTKTAATGYKWYKAQTTDLGYSKTAPQADAKKTSDNPTFTPWQEYTLNKVSSSQTRQVKTRTKLTIKTNINNTSNSEINYNNITNNYVSLEEMLKQAREKGYEINSLLDITNNNKLKYDIKIQYRTASTSN